MGKTIYIQCYEGLSAKMMVEALLNLMPEQTQAKATVWTRKSPSVLMGEHSQRNIEYI